jgi:hypothetical protein
MTILLKLTLANANSAQTVLYFFLLMLYKLSHVKYFEYLLLFFHKRYSFKRNLCFFFYQFASRTHPSQSVIMNFKYFTSRQKWIKSNKRYLIRWCFHIDIILRIIGCKVFGFHDVTTIYIEFRYFVLSKIKCNNE